MADQDEDTDAARADLCRFLAACYYQPAQEFEEERLFDSMCVAASRIDAGLAERARRLGGEFSAAGPERLLADYARLFLGPPPILAKPYGSVWLGGQAALMQDSTMAVLRCYEEGGFEMSETFRELPDHIAAELEFLYLLIYRENQARRSGESEALAAVAGLRRRFLAEHLGRWIGSFAAAVKSGAQCAFYRELAALTEAVVRMEVAAR